MATTSEIGSSLLNATGAGSGIDVTAMATAMAEAEVAARRANVERKEEKATTELSALGYLKTNLAAVQTYVTDLADSSSFDRRLVTSSDESVIQASVSNSAPPGNYAIEVQKMAQAHTVVSDTVFSSMGSTVSNGTLTIQVGAGSYDLTINDSNNTLEGLRNSINNSEMGVNASIINTGSGYQLMLTSQQTGANNAISVSGVAELDSLTTTMAAQDAEIEVNGLSVTSSTNTIENVLDGVTLNVTGADVGSIKTVSVAQDQDTVKANIQNFVDVYNQLDSILDDLGTYEEPDDPDSEEAQYTGDLAGTSSLRSVRDQIRSTLTGIIDGIDGRYNSLAGVGITSNLDGTLNLDEATLDEALANDPTSVKRVFSAAGYTDDPLIQYDAHSDKTQPGSYDINITALAERALVTGTNVNNFTVAANASFDIQLDDMASAATISIASGNYNSGEELARAIQTQINGNTDVKSSGTSVSVTFENGQLNISSDRYGTGSNVTLSNVTNLAAQGLADASDTGVNVAGTVNGYSILRPDISSQDGRKVEISNSALGLGEDIRGLEFTVLGGAIGAREPISFNRGFADRLDSKIGELIDDDGLLGMRESGLQDDLDDVEEQKAKLDERYEDVLLKFKLQFAQLSTMMASMESQGEYITSTISAMLGNDS